MSEQLKCAICGQAIGVDEYGWAGGHNPQPVTEGKCCESCNEEVVLPRRLRDHGFSQEQIFGIEGIREQ